MRIRMTANGTYLAPFLQADLPPSIVFHNLQRRRLANGDTVIFNSTGGAKKRTAPHHSARRGHFGKKLVWCCRIERTSAPPLRRNFRISPASRKCTQICSI
jgi:hypothetical protein